MESFPIAPAATRAMWLLPLVVAVVLVAVVVVVGRSLIASRTASFAVSAAGLELQGDWYGRTIPAAQLLGQRARHVDLGTEAELAPRWRTLGTGLPGYQAGWFRLRNGERALLYLTDRRRAVYVPTTAGYSVMVSPADPDAFLAAVRAIAR